MKLDFGQVIKKFDGHPLFDEDEKVVTFLPIVEGVLSLQEEGKPLSAEKKQMAFQIGVKLYSSKKKGECDLTVDQVKFLKERMGIFTNTLVYGRFCELIGDLQADEKEKPEGE